MERVYELQIWLHCVKRCARCEQMIDLAMFRRSNALGKLTMDVCEACRADLNSIRRRHHR